MKVFPQTSNLRHEVNLVFYDPRVVVWCFDVDLFERIHYNALIEVGFSLVASSGLESCDEIRVGFRFKGKT